MKTRWILISGCATPDRVFYSENEAWKEINPNDSCVKFVDAEEISRLNAEVDKLKHEKCDQIDAKHLLMVEITQLRNRCANLEKSYRDSYPGTVKMARDPLEKEVTRLKDVIKTIATIYIRDVCSGDCERDDPIVQAIEFGHEFAGIDHAKPGAEKTIIHVEEMTKRIRSLEDLVGTIFNRVQDLKLLYLHNYNQGTHFQEMGRDDPPLDYRLNLLDSDVKKLRSFLGFDKKPSVEDFKVPERRETGRIEIKEYLK